MKQPTITPEMAKRIKNISCEFYNDSNRFAKVCASVLRNNIEDFHASHNFPDRCMPDLNRGIRNAIFSYIEDYNAKKRNKKFRYNIDDMAKYVFANTYEILYHNGFGHYSHAEAMYDEMDSGFDKLAKLSYNNMESGGFMAVQEQFYVPSYWEDCEYNPDLKKIVNNENEYDTLSAMMYCIGKDYFKTEETQYNDTTV